ncbi:alpha/beta hydrolase [Marinomonas rhizomae]|uniref:Alpha-beta hydrolase superfamily lysophospholipase n=1 Tax=Marinomonas rhizomae TaxID=491948 RepID=A0A366IZ32_9GAMM|nr:alpha/beta hydrolase [Marinomonas rhizomae]RBP80061.1 alpha-beta hydrolase superfamily lysophospholipase [Marinomonas rhizomae]RNF71984.1 alpha/beta hydrolase [Marinomonas rhizomae]
MSAPIGQHWQQVNECEDLLGADFRARTFSFAGPKTQVHTTLIHHLGNPNATKAILYVHGYTDYFFQTGLAEHFVDLGYRFYALDLQGYGRSIRPSTPPNWCESIEQYGQDLDIALATIKQDGVDQVVILGHSTGGLVVSTYLAQPYALSERESHYNKAFPKVIGLMLNSPFLALPFPPAVLNFVSWPVRILVSLLPFSYLRAKKINIYSKSLHTIYGGEWDYRLDWKPSQGFDLSFHWLREVIVAQRHLANQRLDIPTLMCHSKISTIGKVTIEETQQGDGVLDVDSMQQAAKNTFTNLTKTSIPQGFHDLYLSHQPARSAYLAAMTDWLRSIK